MHLYRYRSPGLLSQKGLLYDEWYFASREELNDPIDMQSKFEFPQNSKKTWFKVFSALWNDRNAAEIASEYFSSICPVFHEQLIKSYEKHAENIFEAFFKEYPISLNGIKNLKRNLNELKAFLSLYEPSAGYSISLSKSNNEMLMWSHYAVSHTGYCLIYRPIGGYLHQCPIRKKDRLLVADHHSSAISTKFKVENIEYDNHLEPIDAFCLLPSHYTGYSFESEEKRLEFHKCRHKQLLTKNECWKYEGEVRLFLPQSEKWISGQSTYSSFQRLFYYDFSQVVGIIFGARMSSEEKDAIREILNSKLFERIKNLGNNSSKKYIFDFLYQQAEICSSSRTVNIIDLELFSMGSMLLPGSRHYTRQLDKWRNFEGITIESGVYGYDSIP